MAMSVTGYVVRFRDVKSGQEGAKCLPTVEDAVEFINGDRYTGGAYEYKLFEIGGEVPLRQRTVEEREKVVVKEHKVWEAV